MGCVKFDFVFGKIKAEGICTDGNNAQQCIMTLCSH